MSSYYPITGVIQPYAWGGMTYLSALLGEGNPDGQPMAEYWLGAHPKGPATLAEGGTLAELIDGQARELLGSRVADRFANRLPFLLKILDVKDMLSIQVHPTKAAAEAGFAREEANGPERTAPNRNYRDDNHKPELGVALTDFYLLHGFRDAAAIRKSLELVPGWEALLPVLEKDGVPGLYRHVMSAPQEDVDRLLGPVVQHVTRNKRAYHREEPEFWVRRAAAQYGKNGHHDRGIFSIYWFNIVHLRPGQGIFQDAGVPHAYLEGVCVELMANSDNVLRGGLTPKHIDVPELLDKTDCSAVTPALLSPVAASGGWHHYPTPAPDFSLSVVRSEDGTVMVDTSDGPAILLLLKGEVSGATGLRLTAERRAAFVPAGEQFSVRVATETELYLAQVG
ncbi:MAG: mannose-6-phosphate isomerase, class I [Bacteroidota bacterium]